MGNCIQKTNRVVLGFDHSAGNVSQKFSAGQKKDNNYNNEKGNLAEWQKQKGFGIVKKTMIPPQTPSGFLENSHPKSHPLPTPNHTSSTSHRGHKKQPSFLPLPKPEAPPPKHEESSSIVISQPAEGSWSSSLSSSSCILPMPMSESEILSSPYLKAFSFDELRKATANFCENSLLGEGGFGCVYKGWLDVETLTAARPGSGMPVAIKKLIHSGFQGHNEWLIWMTAVAPIVHWATIALRSPSCSRGATDDCHPHCGIAIALSCWVAARGTGEHGSGGRGGG
ncbi:UNVERIFIED_CONTAM: putative serine/threonine-protein kinase PBL2 [Sesamum radiatum]|uniref:Serine/threonine-protein kinase PBL2 n=1 Tax=Sesamum radiatum TaxID=300843 RepID=A0AAW2PJC1_SESRA